MSKKKKFRGLTSIFVEDLIIPNLQKLSKNNDENLKIKIKSLKKDIRCPFCNSRIEKDVCWQNGTLAVTGIYYICTNENPNTCKGHTGKISQRWEVNDEFPLSWYRKNSVFYKSKIKEDTSNTMSFKEKRDVAIVKNGIIFMAVLGFFIWLFQS